MALPETKRAQLSGEEEAELLAKRTEQTTESLEKIHDSLAEHLKRGRVVLDRDREYLESVLSEIKDLQNKLTTAEVTDLRGLLQKTAARAQAITGVSFCKKST